MYQKANRIINSTRDLSNYIDSFDVYGSEFFYRLSDPTVEREEYIITTYQYRPDLIALDYYKDASYEGILMLLCGRDLASYTRGAVLRLIPKKTIDSIISDL